jgi:hypothetical protein
MRLEPGARRPKVTHLLLSEGFSMEPFVSSNSPILADCGNNYFPNKEGLATLPGALGESLI